jgi:serine protease Do
MKRWLALVICLMVNGAAVHRLLAQQAAPHIHSAAVIAHGGGYLGIGVAEIDDDRARALKLKDAHGVEIKNVEEDSPAAKAGLKEGDAILEYNGQRVEGVDQFIRMVRETPPNRKAALAIVRNGSPQTVAATIAKRNEQAFAGGLLAPGFELQMPNMPGEVFGKTPTPPLRPFLPDMPHSMLLWESGAIGIEAEALNAQLAEYFGVKDGVLVRSVAHNSPAEKAGIKAGDVVVKVNGETVSTPHEIASQLHGARNKHSVPFGLMRNHKELSLEVKPSDGWQQDSGDHEDL